MSDRPILPGFHPDPSILRVEDEYFIACSTFEWFPGVRIYRSRDLARWDLAARPLGRAHLDLRGIPDSGGIWAPDLSYADGRFHLVFTIVKHFDARGGEFDTRNFLTTSVDVAGPWSAPIPLNASGFDPSLFHDEDGRKWLLNVLWDHRKSPAFDGIVMQEYDARLQRLTGPVHRIFSGTPLGSTEGPHLYRKDEKYFLVTAEGGTSYQHAVTVARADAITGPYEVHPDNPILSARNDAARPVQKTGHGSWVQTPQGDWLMAHLGARPLSPRGRCPLGRETFLVRLEWRENGWPEVARFAQPAEPQRIVQHETFDSGELDPVFDTLRVPSDRASFVARPGFLRLRGGESLRSRHDQILVARRVQAFRATATTRVDFRPENFQQMAGLVLFYDTNNWLYLFLSQDVALGRMVGVGSCLAGVPHAGRETWRAIGSDEICRLRVVIDYPSALFQFSADGAAWTEIGPAFDASLLSDETCAPLAFTGTFVGLCCQDLSGADLHADFDDFTYEET